MKTLYSLLVVILLIIPRSLNAQNYIDLAKFDYSFTPSNSFDNGIGGTKLQEANGDLTIPIQLNENAAILTGVTYELTHASFDPGHPVESLHGITLKAGANIKHNSKWSGTYLLLPKVSSDLKNINGNDFQFGGAILMKRTINDHLNYKFGVYSNSELFGPFVVPMLGVYYLNSTKKFEAKILLPLAGDVNYTFAKNTRIGLNFKGQIRTYNLNSPIGNIDQSYVARSTNDLYSYLQYGLNNGLQFQLGFGRSIGRSYRMFNEKVPFAMPLVYFDDQRTQLNTDFSDGWLFKLGIFYRLDLSK